MDRKRIISTVVLGLLAVGAQARAQTPAELIAIKDAARAALNAHDLEAFLSYLDEDAIFDLVSAPVQFQGKEQIGAVMGGEFTSFPDWHSAAGRRWAPAGIVVEEPTISGTHMAMWNGIPPTGNPVQLNGLEIVDFEGDKIKRITMYVDMTTEMVQLGVVAPGAPPEPAPSFAVPAPEPTGLAPVAAVLEAKRRYNAHDFAGYARMFRADASTFSVSVSAIVVMGTRF